MPPQKRVIRKPKSPVLAASVDLDEQVIVLHDLRKQAADIAEQIPKIQEAVVTELDAIGETKWVVKTADGSTYTASRGQNSRTVIDEQKLKRRLGPAIWRKVTTLLLDRKKLEAFIASGEVDPVKVAECSAEFQSTPFVKVTKR